MSGSQVEVEPSNVERLAQFRIRIPRRAAPDDHGPDAVRAGTTDHVTRSHIPPRSDGRPHTTRNGYRPVSGSAGPQKDSRPPFTQMSSLASMGSMGSMASMVALANLDEEAELAAVSGTDSQAIRQKSAPSRKRGRRSTVSQDLVWDERTTKNASRRRSQGRAQGTTGDAGRSVSTALWGSMGRMSPPSRAATCRGGRKVVGGGGGLAFGSRPHTHRGMVSRRREKGMVSGERPPTTSGNPEASAWKQRRRDTVRSRARSDDGDSKYWDHADVRGHVSRASGTSLSSSAAGIQSLETARTAARLAEEASPSSVLDTKGTCGAQHVNRMLERVCLIEDLVKDGYCDKLGIIRELVTICRALHAECVHEHMRNVSNEVQEDRDDYPYVSPTGNRNTIPSSSTTTNDRGVSGTSDLVSILSHEFGGLLEGEGQSQAAREASASSPADPANGRMSASRGHSINGNMSVSGMNLSRQSSLAESPSRRHLSLKAEQILTPKLVDVGAHQQAIARIAKDLEEFDSRALGSSSSSLAKSSNRRYMQGPPTRRFSEHARKKEATAQLMARTALESGGPVPPNGSTAHIVAASNALGMDGICQLLETRIDAQEELIRVLKRRVAVLEEVDGLAETVSSFGSVSELLAAVARMRGELDSLRSRERRFNADYLLRRLPTDRYCHPSFYVLLIHGLQNELLAARTSLGDLVSVLEDHNARVEALGNENVVQGAASEATVLARAISKLDENAALSATTFETLLGEIDLSYRDVEAEMGKYGLSAAQLVTSADKSDVDENKGTPLFGENPADKLKEEALHHVPDSMCRDIVQGKAVAHTLFTPREMLLRGVEHAERGKGLHGLHVCDGSSSITRTAQFIEHLYGPKAGASYAHAAMARAGCESHSMGSGVGDAFSPIAPNQSAAGTRREEWRGVKASAPIADGDEDGDEVNGGEEPGDGRGFYMRKSRMAPTSLRSHHASMKQGSIIDDPFVVCGRRLHRSALHELAVVVLDGRAGSSLTDSERQFVREKLRFMWQQRSNEVRGSKWNKSLLGRGDQVKRSGLGSKGHLADDLSPAVDPAFDETASMQDISLLRGRCECLEDERDLLRNQLKSTDEVILQLKKSLARMSEVTRMMHRKGTSAMNTSPGGTRALSASIISATGMHNSLSAYGFEGDASMLEAPSGRRSGRIDDSNRHCIVTAVEHNNMIADYAQRLADAEKRCRVQTSLIGLLGEIVASLGGGSEYRPMCTRLADLVVKQDLHILYLKRVAGALKKNVASLETCAVALADAAILQARELDRHANPGKFSRRGAQAGTRRAKRTHATLDMSSGVVFSPRHAGAWYSPSRGGPLGASFAGGASSGRRDSDAAVDVRSVGGVGGSFVPSMIPQSPLSEVRVGERYYSQGSYTSGSFSGNGYPHDGGTSVLQVVAYPVAASAIGLVTMLHSESAALAVRLEASAIKIQALWRGHVTRKSLGLVRRNHLWCRNSKSLVKDAQPSSFNRLLDTMLAKPETTVVVQDARIMRRVMNELRDHIQGVVEAELGTAQEEFDEMSRVILERVRRADASRFAMRSCASQTTRKRMRSVSTMA